MSRAMGAAHAYPTRRRGGRALRGNGRALCVITSFFADLGAKAMWLLYFLAAKDSAGWRLVTASACGRCGAVKCPARLFQRLEQAGRARCHLGHRAAFENGVH
jgi:hypothetical protein